MGILELAGFWGFVNLVVALYAIVQTLNSQAEPLGKAFWIALIVFFPFGGWLLWIFFGPEPKRKP